MTQISVLIADDLPFLVDALRDLLEGDPSIVVVETANDAVAAVEAAATARPDVALLDVRMPAGGGGAAARGIRQVSPGTKIVALSAHFDHASVMEMVRAGRDRLRHQGDGTGRDHRRGAREHPRREQPVAPGDRADHAGARAIAGPSGG